MRVWVCVRVTWDRGAGLPPPLGLHHRQEIQGIYTTEDKAKARCRIADRDFIAPAPLDVDFPDETLPWPGAYWPLVQDRPEEPS